MAQTTPITGVVTEKDKTTGANVLASVKGVAKPTADTLTTAATLVDTTLSAVFSAGIEPLRAGTGSATAYSR